MGATMRINAVVRLLVTLLLTVGAGVGWQLDAELIWQITATVLALVSLVWAWWKNAPITDEAVDAQQYLVMLKDGTIPVGIERLLVDSQNTHDEVDVAEIEVSE